MMQFIEQLKKRSSTTCTEMERYGWVGLEFEAYEDAEAFRAHVVAFEEFGATFPPTDWMDKKAARRYYNFQDLLTILKASPVPQIQRYVMYPMPDEDNQEPIIRHRLAWEFDSANKAHEFFSRLLWVQE